MITNNELELIEEEGTARKPNHQSQTDLQHNHAYTNNQNQIAETANLWYEEQKDVLDDGRFFQQFEKSVDKTWTLADPSSDESDQADVQKQDVRKIRLLSS